MLRIIVGHNVQPIRKFNFSAVVHKANARPIVSLDKKVSEELEDEKYKPRQHPGIVKSNVIALPSRITASIFKSIKGDTIHCNF